MGIDKDLGIAFAKSQIATGFPLPSSGNIFLSVKDSDKAEALKLARQFLGLGFHLYTTPGTSDYFMEQGIDSSCLFYVSEGTHPNVIDMIKNDDIAMVINTPAGMLPMQDENKIRAEAIAHGICTITNLCGAWAALNGIKALKQHAIEVTPIQERMRLVEL